MQPDTQKKTMQELATRKYLREESHKRIFSNVRRSIALFMVSLYFLSLYLLGLAGLNPFSICSLMFGMILLGPDLVNGIIRAHESIFGKETPPYSADAEYSIARTLANKGLFAEAETEYERIAADNPDDPRPHIEMIEISTLRMNNPGLAEALYRKGMASLKSEASKAALTDLYLKMKSLLKSPQDMAIKNISLDTVAKAQQHAEELRKITLYGSADKHDNS